MRCITSNNDRNRGRYAIGVGSACVLFSKFVLQAHGLTEYCSYGISHVFDQRLTSMFHREGDVGCRGDALLLVTLSAPCFIYSSFL